MDTGPGQLVCSQVIDVIMDKPEFQFLIRYYNLLYQSLIPNCKLTINTLRQHIDISDDVVQYVVGAASRRTSSQRLVNFLLHRLNSDKNYMQFCYHLNIISIFTDLSDKLITEYNNNDRWGHNAQGLVLHKMNCDDVPLNKWNDTSNNSKGHSSSSCSADICTAQHVICDGAVENRAEKCSIGSHYHVAGRRRCIGIHSDHIQGLQQQLQRQHQQQHQFRWQCSNIAQSLPNNYEMTLEMLKDHLTDDQICRVLSSPNSSVANSVILDCLMEKNTTIQFCELLEIITPISSKPELLLAFINNVKTSSTTLHSIANNMPKLSPLKLANTKEFFQLKEHYQTILNLMPDNFEVTVGKLQKFIGDDQICRILNSTSSSTANKLILDCLIERMTYKEELLDFCHQLDSISTSQQLRLTINKIRSDVFDAVPTPIGSSYNASHDATTGSYDASTGTHDATTGSHDATTGSHDATIGSHDATTGSHDATTGSHDATIGSHDATTGSHDATTGSHVSNTGSHDVSTGSHDATIESHDATAGSHDTTIRSHDATITSHNTTALTSGHILHLNQGTLPSSNDLRKQLEYDQIRLRRGFKYQQPPLFPQNCIPRQTLWNEIATKLCQAAAVVDPHSVGTSVTITGAAGFGKTTTAVSLCYHPVVKEKFTDGFLFIELGPNATDPTVKLRAIYSLLTDEQCDINVVEQKIKQVTSNYYRNLLVIIDDVWHVEDAEPLVMAFSHCTILLTTRMNNIEQYIPTVNSVSIGPMEQHEAISLLTKGVITIDQLSSEDHASLNELVQDVHFWPLLLSLIRGHLFHSLKQHNSSYHKAIQNVQCKLHDSGLTAFDKNSFGNVSKMRKYAVQVCINVTLELLTRPLSDKLKSLILYSGIGTSIATVALHSLWNISKQEAEDTSDLLWAYGLLQFSSAMMPFSGQHCQVHTIISHYIVETMESVQVMKLSPYGVLGTDAMVSDSLATAFEQSQGNPSSLPARKYLQYTLNGIESVILPCLLQEINRYAITDPHCLKIILHDIQKFLLDTAPDTLSVFKEELTALVTSCKRCLQNSLKLSRKLNQKCLRSLHENKYNDLIKTVEEYLETYPIYNIAHNAIITMKKRVIPHVWSSTLASDHQIAQIDFMLNALTEYLHSYTPDYHDISAKSLNYIKLLVRFHQEGTSVLQKGSLEEVEIICNYWHSGKLHDELKQARTYCDIAKQKVQPNLTQWNSIF
ncbi:uncharacterized protein [Dysidea avara]